MIIALSDTHLEGPLPNASYLPDKTIDLIKKAQLVLHAGDFTCQTAYDFLVDLCVDCQCELWAIQGNPPDPPRVPAIKNYSTGKNLPMEMIDERFGLKIGLKHDANGSYDFSESYALDVAAKMQSVDGEVKGADLMVFGHIHEPIISWTKGKHLLICPGPGTSIARYHKCPPYPSVAQINVENGRISSVQIISINKGIG
ncbi:MAG: metallophosphoesterase family protein [Methanothrix sp.]|jgi:putative phosphoesterase|nr:metallophosphoesterase family protein [Methanothrix sp.]